MGLLGVWGIGLECGLKPRVVWGKETQGDALGWGMMPFQGLGDLGG